MSFTAKTVLDTDILGSDRQGTRDHASIHNEVGSVVNDLQDKVGIDNSTDATSLDYKVSNTSSSNPGHKHTLANGATDVTASATELNYVDGVTSPIQTQLNAKQATITGGATTIDTEDLTVSRALVSDSSGKVAVATTTSTEIGYVNGVTSAIQTQLNNIPSNTASYTNKTIIQRTASYTPSGAGTTTLDLSTGGIHSVTMPASTQTLAISNGTVGQCFIVEINNVTSQGALTWFSTIRWATGVAPTLTGTNGKRDTFGFRITGSNTYDGYIVGQNI